MTDSYNRYTVQRDTAGHAWLKGRAGGSVRIDAVVAIFTLHNCELWATVTGGRDVLLDDAADHDHGVGDMLEKHQQQIEQLLLANATPARTPHQIPAHVMVGKEHAVAFQCYEDFGKRRYGVVAEIPLNIETRRDPGSSAGSVYVRNERLSFSTRIYGGYGPVLDARDADKWVSAILEAIALGIRYIDLVIFRTPDELIHHARAQADAAR